MKKEPSSIYNLFKYTLLLFFVRMVFRLVFLLSNFDAFPSIDKGGSLFKSVLMGLFYDIKWSAIFIIIPILLLCFKSVFSPIFIKIYTIVLLGLASFGFAFNTLYYREWYDFIHLDSFTVIQHEGMTAPLGVYIVLSIILGTLLFIGLYLLFNTYFLKGLINNESNTNKPKELWLLIPAIILLFFGNQYFSNHSSIKFYNHLAQGPSLMYLGSSANSDDKWLDTPYIGMNVAVDNYYKLFKSHFHDSTLNLSQKDWHVQVVLHASMDTFAAQPFITFSNNTTTTQSLNQILPELINGFPNLPHIDMVTYPDKIEQMPSIVQSFNNKGYETNFYVSRTLRNVELNNYFQYLAFDHETSRYQDIQHTQAKSFDLIILDEPESELWFKSGASLDTGSLLLPISYYQAFPKMQIYTLDPDTSYTYNHFFNTEDLAVTLLNMLKIPTGGYIFSKDIISDSIPHFGLDIDDFQAQYRDDTSSYTIQFGKQPFKDAPDSKSNKSDYLLSILQMVQEDFRSK